MFHRLVRLGLWCLTPLSTIFQLYRGLSVLSVEKTGVRGENKLPAKIHFTNCYYCYSYWLTPFCSFLFKIVLDTGIHTHSSVETSHLKHGGEEPEIKQNKNKDNDKSSTNIYYNHLFDNIPWQCMLLVVSILNFRQECIYDMDRINCDIFSLVFVQVFLR